MMPQDEALSWLSLQTRMKRLISIVFLLFTLQLSAQEKIFRSVAMSDEQLLISLFTDYWEGTPEDVDQRLVNPGLSVYLLYDRPLGLSNFSIAFGLGWVQHNFHSNAYPVRDVLLGGGSTYFYLVPGRVGLKTIEYTRNKVSLGYLSLPLEFRYRSRSDLKFKFSIGATASLLGTSYIKYRGNDFWGNPDELVRLKRYRIPNIAPFVYSVQSRIGVRQWGFQVMYQIPSSFRKGLGPELRPLSFGLTYNPA
jgi:hypothetical protein